MLSAEMKDILAGAREYGWVMEPEAKRLFLLAGLPVPRFALVKTQGEVERAALEIGFPLAAKVVSPQVLHKSDVGGVALNIGSVEELSFFFSRVQSLPGFAGIHVEEMSEGIELIVGAKIDSQFGPVVLVGLGGTGVEIYQDVAMRMAPLIQGDTASMVAELKGARLLAGYRGGVSIDMDALERTLIGFSSLVMEIAPYIESIDLNPLLCSGKGCVIADARIMLAGDE